MTRISGFRSFDIVYSFNNISEFFAKYKQEEKKKELLNNYLIYCFVYKKFDHIQSIISHFNLDIINTRLTFNQEFLKFDLSLVCFGVFCNDIDFIKYLLQINEPNYTINEDYNDYYSVRSDLNLDEATPLFVAVGYTKNRDIIDLLIKYGADINARNARHSTPIMNVDCNEENLIEYYQFLISRGANINSQNKAGNTTLHKVIRRENFDLALDLIYQCEANPFLVNNQKCDGLMYFIIYLNIYDGYDEYTRTWVFSMSSDKKVNYVEKLLAITNNRNLIYDLFAACIKYNSSLKMEYFNKVKKSLILHNDRNSIYWRNNFNNIVGDDNDENYYIQSVKVFNRLLHVYNYDTVLYIILYHILEFYEYTLHQYDKYVQLLMYVLNVVTYNLKSFQKLYGAASKVYYVIFHKFNCFILTNYPNLLLENILEIFQEMIRKFTIHKNYLKNEWGYNYNFLVKQIHLFIYYIYEKCFNDETKRILVEKYIKDKYPINLTDNDNNCILHTILNDAGIFKDYDDDEIFENHEIIYNFLLVILECNNFKHLNLRNKENQIPLQLAIVKDRNKDIIQLLLNYDSVVFDLNFLCNKYPSLQIFKNYVNLQNLAAKCVKQQKQDYIPKILQEIVYKY